MSLIFGTKEENSFWDLPDTTTANDMPAYSTTNSALLDIFYKIGNMSTVDDDFLALCREAFCDNADDLLAVILWARDCREGAGRRNVPRVLLRRWFAKGNLSKSTGRKILEKLVELGRWDDVWAVALNTPYEQEMEPLILEALRNGDRLCAKWLPRKGPVAAQIRRLLDMSPKHYRKTIVNLTKVVETPICKGKFHEIDYSTVPSVAMKRYARLFNEKDSWRFEEYKENLKKGTAKVNVKVLYPYQILQTLFTDSKLAEAQWETKVKEVQTKNVSFLPVIDTSGSMTCMSGAPGVQCIDIAVSLGLLVSEASNNAFKGRFITFSESPTMIDLRHLDTFSAKVNCVRNANWGFNTDIEKVFNLILKIAKGYDFDQSQLPKYILIISDMQFDQAVENKPAIKMIKRNYAKAGYTAPTVVFWNVANSYNNFPAIEYEEGCILISGFNANLLEQLLDNPDNINPAQFLKKVISSPRYRI